ncbi:MAG: RNA ligase family protein [Candidatus Marinimicrobia bacterium]|jgi:hypothetical protein|nr:RNA ligase family protein [Candidatus Neomarinimicrobiota bacterium]
MEYHKIQSVYKRDERGNFILGQWSIPEFSYLKGNIWEFTEKIDGTNIRIYWDGQNIRICGKTDNAPIPAKLIDSINASTLTKNLTDKYPDLTMCLYCEGYGAGIRKGGVYRQDQSIVLFDILIDRWWLRREDVLDIGNKLELSIVPQVGEGTLERAIEIVRCGYKSMWGDFVAEGLVMRPKVGLFSRKGERIIAKVKHKDFKVK